MDEMNIFSDSILSDDSAKIDVENLSAGHVNYVSMLEQIFGRLPKILIYASSAVFFIIYICSVTASLPVVFVSSLVVGTVFALRAAAEFWRIFKNKSDDYINKEADRENPEGKSSITIEKQRWLDFIALLISGLSLIVLGTILLASPMILGIFLQASIIFKISLIAFGSLFIFKSISYFESKLSCGRLGYIFKNLPDTLLYGAGLLLGISSLIMTGGLSIVPILFTSFFACRTASSICHMFPNKRIARNLAIKLEAVSLVIIACALIFSGILLAPTFATLIGTSTLFVKIALLITGFLFACSALAKFLVGLKLKELEEVHINFSCELKNPSLTVVTPGTPFHKFNPSYERPSEEAAPPNPQEFIERPKEENNCGCFHLFWS